MTRLRSLIKEALSTPPNKKDCECGCNDCEGKAPILTEGKIKHLISEGLIYHVENKIPLHESVYRIGSEKHFDLINEARTLWVRGLIDVSEDDQAILETHLGSFGMYEGEKVPLDMPMVNEEEKDRFAGSDSKAGSTIQGTGFDWEKKMPSQEEVNEVTSMDVYNTAKKIHGAKLKGTAESFTIPYEFGSINLYDNQGKFEIEYESGGTTQDTDTIDYEQALKVVKASYLQDFKEAINVKDYDPDAEQDDEDVPNPVDDEGRPLGESLEERIDRILEARKKKKKKKKKDPPIGKPKRGGPKAYYVYVRDPKTKRIKKVTFGSGGLRAKIRNPKARNAFAKRHRCSEKNDRTKASYWSCRLPRYAKQLGLGSNMNTFW